MSESSVILKVSSKGVATVTLNNPPVNAMGMAVRRTFIQTMDELAARADVRCIVLTAQGKVFCAGADLKEKSRLADDDTGYADANRLTRDSFFSILNAPKPVIAAVNGPAIGAGFVMIACCDFTVASKSAFFSMPEIDVGQGGGASFLQRIIPLPKMRRMLLTGERIPAQELYRLGTIEEVVEPENVLPTAGRIAETIAEKSPKAVRKIRSSFLTVEHLPLVEGFAMEQAYTTELSLSDDAREARQAFAEKRKAKFE